VAAAQRQRRRGNVPTVAAPGTKGKEVGEDEGLARKLTAGSVWAEGGRRGEIDEGGGAPVRQHWWPAMAARFLLRSGLIELVER